MKRKAKFLPTLEMKYKQPFQQSKTPSAGPNAILNLDEMNCVDVEIRGAGRGLLNGEEAEYMDIRVYLQDKTPG